MHAILYICIKFAYILLMQVMFGLKKNPVDVFSCLVKFSFPSFSSFVKSGVIALFTKPYLSNNMIRLLHTHPGGPGGPGGPISP